MRLKFQVDTLFSDLMENTYWATTCTFIDINWAWRIQLPHILGLEESNKNVFESFAPL